MNDEQFDKLTLGQKQELFMRLLPRLIDFATAQGFQLRGGELKRGVAQAAANQMSGIGISNSLHLISLAIDINLFKDGKWLQMSQDHKPLGEFWEKLHPLCRWGGRFTRPDGNHYAITHEGRS